ncbi:MAG: PorT family protein [Chitinophagaceae bacterium]|nr:PorT family protein [Chitinophagaceae bacterium]
MKIIIAASLILCYLGSLAQKSKFDAEHENFFRVGLKGGVNINKIEGQSYKSGFSYNYLLGGFMQFNFSKTLGLQPEINFTQSTSQFTDDRTDIYDDLFLGGSQKKVKLSYIKVPALLNINIGESKRVKLQLGPQVGGLLKETVDSLKNNGSIFKKADWNAVGGLWIQLPFVNLGARYELGLSNLNGIDNRQNWKSQAITIFVGVTF